MIKSYAFVYDRDHSAHKDAYVTMSSKSKAGYIEGAEMHRANNNKRTPTDARDYAGTTIKTPFERMRANAIINARNDHAGLSLINFNITAFLPKSKRDDAYYLLSQWAIEPVNLQKAKFVQYPQQGEQALKKRCALLIENLSMRSDMPEGFLITAQQHMEKEIVNAISATTAANTADQDTALHA